MTRTNSSRWRNLGIIAHIDAGKTTLTERLLWTAGAIHRTGEVHHGNSTTDYSDIERRRGITIGAAAVRLRWTPTGDTEHRFTLIDTPGHIDFAIEVERSLRVLDGAVAVFSAVDGVQPQSETVWRQADHHELPRIAVINKMDRPGANFARVVDALRTVLDARAWPMGLPLGEAEDFRGWIDLVAECTWLWQVDGAVTMQSWSALDRSQYLPKRLALIEAVAEHDDELESLYLSEASISADALRAALRRATLAGAGVPVIAASAYRNQGMQAVLDAIAHYLPSPMDRPAVRAEREQAAVWLPPNPDATTVALVFKVTPLGQTMASFVRVYSGRLSVGQSVWCARAQRVRRIGRLAAVQADRTTELDAAVAGEIVAILGWKDSPSGETLSAPEDRLQLEAIATQPPVLAWRIEALQKSDLLRLGQGLSALALQDPSFQVKQDPDTGDTVVYGMGELHLDVMVERLRQDFGVTVRTGAPQVAYQETPATAVTWAEGKIEKRNGGVGQFARVVLSIAPMPDLDVQIVDETIGGSIPKPFVASVEKGLRQALQEGPRGVPVVGLQIRIIDGEAHSVDSSDLAFQRAAFTALQHALQQSGTRLLEPVMQLQIDTPAQALGDVIGEVQKRQGQIQQIDDRGLRVDVRAHAPLAKLHGYTTSLRSLSQGRAEASMQFLRYEVARVG
ncbi:elongation factor G [Ahniella affigens]|uniref:Elongation factor G n=1 Tax=Ahniella affigens TaxID=2021234 RepID=A0A2P1PMX6_9GAMM|nr:elongation factor G [Ahniella affigens]AVP96200.1 elongation factor G [Ahniella affigens]